MSNSAQCGDDVDEKVQGHAEPIANPPAASVPRAPGDILQAVLEYASSSPTVSPSMVLPAPAPAPRPMISTYLAAPANSASEIIPRLFISDIFTALNPTVLRTLRITHIISVVECVVTFPEGAVVAPVAQPQSDLLMAMSASDSDSPLPPLKMLHIPLMDLPSVDIFSHFATTREFIAVALRDEGARVLVHCYKGQSRSPTIVAAYLIATYNMTTGDALTKIRTTRPEVLPNRGFRRQLEQYEEVLREEADMVCSEK